MHWWRASLSHAAGLLVRPCLFGMAKAGAQAMEMCDTSDELTGSSGDLANQGGVGSDNPTRRYGDGDGDGNCDRGGCGECGGGGGGDGDVERVACGIRLVLACYGVALVC